MTFDVVVREGGPNGATTTIDGALSIERDMEQTTVVTDNEEYAFMSDATIVRVESEEYYSD